MTASSVGTQKISSRPPCPEYSRNVSLKLTSSAATWRPRRVTRRLSGMFSWSGTGVQRSARWRANCRRTSEYDGRLATTSACSSDGRSAFLGDRLHHLAERLSWTFSNVADVGAHLPVQLLSLDHGLWKWLTVSMVIHFRILTSLHCAVNHRYVTLFA